MSTYKSEKDVKRDVKKLLNKHKWFWFMPPSNSFGRTGISDFICLRGGVPMAVETKFGKNKPTAMQGAFLESFAAEGGFGFVVDEENLKAFEEWMALFDQAVEDSATGTKKMEDEVGARLLDLMVALTDVR